MLELLIIKELLLLDNYNKYRHHIKLKEDDKGLKHLYSVLDKLISSYSRDITLDEFKLAVLSEYPIYSDFLHQVEFSDIGQDVLKDSISSLVEKSIAYDLALLAIEVSDGKKGMDSILEFYDKIEKKSSIEEVTFVTDDLEEIYQTTMHTPGLRWRLNTLNKSLGSLRRGDFGFLFSRPETGKTTFLASEVTHFAGQTENPILWINNEEGGSKVKSRCFQAALGLTLTELYQDRNRNYKKYMEVTKGNIKILDSATTSHRQIDRICKDMNPSLIVFDQIDKIKGFNADRNDLRLGAIYIWARELAKTYCPVIGVCQADVTAEGKRFLTMDNVAESKTAKQAEADWILGIGKIHDINSDYDRFLHLSKNKLMGDEDTKPELRHGRMSVMIRPDIARYEDTA